MYISKKILKAINEGVLLALSFDKDELEPSEEFDILLTHTDINSEDIKKKYYTQKLQELLTPKIDKYGVFNGDNTDIDTAIEWHKQYGATYIPTTLNGQILDEILFKSFIDSILNLYAYDGYEDDEINVDLNWINTSNVTSMFELFGALSPINENIRMRFNGDISEWDVSNVKDMGYMFAGFIRHNGNRYKTKFNGDLSKWDVSNVKSMTKMFSYSSFNNDSICNWNVQNVIVADQMFYISSFKQNLSNWDLSKCDNHIWQFAFSPMEDNKNQYPKYNK